MLLVQVPAKRSEQSKIREVVRHTRTEPKEMFWEGFCLALEAADKTDRIADYPAAQDAQALIEVKRLLMHERQPPIS